MKVVFFNRFFWPDPSATSQMLSDLAFALAGRGMSVHVVASLSSPELAARETVRGVTIHRVAPARVRKGIVGKAREYVDYYLGARRAAREILQPGDVAVFKTDPPLMLPMVGPVAHRRGARIVNWLQDIFPEVAIHYGIPGARTPLLRQWRDRWLRRSTLSVAISDGMKAGIRSSAALADSAVAVIHNWADGDAVRPLPEGSSALRREWGLADSFVVCYSGNLGRVHEFETMIDAAERLKHQRDVSFLVVGWGPQLDEVKAAVAAKALPNVVFKPLQQRQSLSDSLGLPDVHLCILRPEFEGLVVPSKFYGILAAGRPCIYIGEPGGDLPRLLQSHGCGLGVNVGDGVGLAQAVLQLKSDRTRAREMGRRGRQLFDREFDMRVAVPKWQELIESAAQAA